MHPVTPRGAHSRSGWSHTKFTLLLPMLYQITGETEDSRVLSPANSTKFTHNIGPKSYWSFIYMSKQSIEKLPETLNKCQKQLFTAVN